MLRLTCNTCDFQRYKQEKRERKGRFDRSQPTLSTIVASPRSKSRGRKHLKQGAYKEQNENLTFFPIQLSINKGVVVVLVIGGWGWGGGWEGGVEAALGEHYKAMRIVIQSSVFPIHFTKFKYELP